MAKLHIQEKAAEAAILSPLQKALNIHMGINSVPEILRTLMVFIEYWQYLGSRDSFRDSHRKIERLLPCLLRHKKRMRFSDRQKLLELASTLNVNSECKQSLTIIVQLLSQEGYHYF
ncbi:MAG: hypothetical protein R2865_12355 [Deinococcales bacterium]